MAKRKREVEFDGTFYRVRSNTVDLPDLKAMNRFDALIWLNRHTYARGHSTKSNVNLRGYSGAVTVS